MKSERLGSCSKDLKVVVVMEKVAVVNKVVVLEAEVMDAVLKMPTAGNAN